MKAWRRSGGLGSPSVGLPPGPEPATLTDLGGGEQSVSWVSGVDPPGHWRVETRLNGGPWLLYQLVVPTDRDLPIIGVAGPGDTLEARVRGEEVDFTATTEWAVSNVLVL